MKNKLRLLNSTSENLKPLKLLPAGRRALRNHPPTPEHCEAAPNPKSASRHVVAPNLKNAKRRLFMESDSIFFYTFAP